MAKSRGQMAIRKRYVDSKRHTIGYLVGGRRRSVKETVQLVRQGRVMNARVVGNHVQSQIGETPLSALETVVSKQ